MQRFGKRFRLQANQHFVLRKGLVMKADAIVIESTVRAFLRHTGFQVDGQARGLPSGVFPITLTCCDKKVFFLYG